jgi:hypothetical protein
MEYVCEDTTRNQNWGEIPDYEQPGILLDNMHCSGEEMMLRYCDHNGWKDHNCSHYEDVLLTCRKY